MNKLQFVKVKCQCGYTNLIQVYEVFHVYENIKCEKCGKVIAEPKGTNRILEETSELGLVSLEIVVRKKGGLRGLSLNEIYDFLCCCYQVICLFISKFLFSLSFNLVYKSHQLVDCSILFSCI